nr:immunoglobulin heavy chain junction region [Macaca mulatta]MOV39336.1 immunoglobulin heavy chain junction region [Macaca mulatta]MOV40229.1 immunoglobulin heavy chain junction region [Macaca mulatta]MOV42081.1 immunoglobulin heavy chain junction region [Macaca mulatta]MOV44743.1 immunoglobulin heavy chain junction region [Macaca mulatta]
CVTSAGIQYALDFW